MKTAPAPLLADVPSVTEAREYFAGKTESPDCQWADQTSVTIRGKSLNVGQFLQKADGGRSVFIGLVRSDSLNAALQARIKADATMTSEGEASEYYAVLADVDGNGFRILKPD